MVLVGGRVGHNALLTACGHRVALRTGLFAIRVDETQRDVLLERGKGHRSLLGLVEKLGCVLLVLWV